MIEPLSILSLYAASKVAIQGWLAQNGADFAKEKLTGLAGEEAQEIGKTQWAQFCENAKLHLRKPDSSIPKSLRLAYLQATLQVCALRGDELGVDVTSYNQHLTVRILRWKKRFDEPLGIFAQGEAQWLDRLHQWLRVEMAKAKEGQVLAIKITDHDLVDLVPLENDIEKESLQQRLTAHLISEIEQACPDLPDGFHSLLIQGWDQFDVYEQAQRVTWFDCFCVCFQKALAQDSNACEFFQTKLLAEITHQQRRIDFEQFADALRSFNEQLAEQNLPAYFEGLSLRLETGFQSLHERLGKLETTVDAVRDATEQILKKQDAQTERLLVAFRDGTPFPGNDLFDNFLSHVIEDSALVELLRSTLLRKDSLTVWLDKWQMTPEKRWQQSITKPLTQAKTCAVCIGPHTPQNWFRDTIEMALYRREKHSSFRVIPVLLPGADISLINRFSALRSWVIFNDSLNDDNVLDFLLSGIKGIHSRSYQSEIANQNYDFSTARGLLLDIQSFHQEKLIRDEVAQDAQRQIINQYITRPLKQ